MLNERPLRWIGDAEARQMLLQVVSETSPAAFEHIPDAYDAPATWFGRVRRWAFSNRSVEAEC